MREIYTHPEFTRVGFARGLLEQAGIPCFIRNEHTHDSMRGGVAYLADPTLCIVNDDDYDRAMAIVQGFVQPPTASGPDWKCVGCGETVPASFDSCWKCETLRASIAVE